MAHQEKRQGEMTSDSDTAPVAAPLFPSARLTVTVMMFLACLLTYVLRLNLGFAVVCMITDAPPPAIPVSLYDNMNTSKVNAFGTPAPPGVVHYDDNVLMTSLADEDAITDAKSDDVCVGPRKYAHKNESHSGGKKGGEFTWGKSLQGALLGAFFYGYIITQIPAGWLCDKIGGKIVIGVGLGMVTFLTLLLPEAARISPYAMLAVRVLQGMCAAVSFPAIHSIVGNWAPPTERGLLMSISYSGMYVGTLLTFPICGLLCDYGFAGGWPSIFYVTGMVGVVYVVSLIFLVYNGYESHPRISADERRYLQKTLVGHHGSDARLAIPWLELAKSGPVWAIILAHHCANWGLYTLVINLPLFMKEVLRFDIKQNGFLSALPYFCTLILTLACGKLSDLLQKRKVCSMTVLRKTFTTIGMVVPAICMLTLTFLHCEQRYIAVGVITTCQAMTAFAYSGGFFYNHVDLSPSHAGVLMGITNMFGTIPGIVSSLLVGLLTPNGTREEWATIFYILTAMYSIGTIGYLILGSGERQPWSYTDEELSNQQETQRFTADKKITSGSNSTVAV